MTGGRIKRVAPYLDGDFCLTYGDGLADIDVQALRDFHAREGALCTLTAVQPPRRFGALELSGSRIQTFREKPEGDGAWINGGFFVCSPAVVDLIEGDANHLGAGTTGAPWRGPSIDRLPAPWLLAANGHSAGEDAARSALGIRQGPLEGVVMFQDVSAGSGSLSQGTRDSRALAHPVAAGPGRRGHWLRPGPRHRPPACSRFLGLEGTRFGTMKWT